MNLSEIESKQTESIPDDLRGKYWSGTQNRAIRYYFYCTRGLMVFNEGRYLAMGIFALYFALKVDNPWLIPLMFAISLPAIAALGWLFTHKMAKVMDFLNIHFSTHWTKYSVELQEEQNKILRQIRDKEVI